MATATTVPSNGGKTCGRQRVLERVGWRFWRCFASSFYRDPEGVLNDLVETLTRMGIEPPGKSETGRPKRRFTEHRTIEPAAAEPSAPGEVAGIDLGALQDETADTAGTAAGIGLGDKVVLLFSDDQKRISVRLSEGDNDLEKGRLAIGSPLGRAILGAEEGDEVELALENGRQRKVLIESVGKNPAFVAAPPAAANTVKGAAAVAYPSLATVFHAQEMDSPEGQSPELGQPAHQTRVPEVVSVIEVQSPLEPGAASTPELSLLGSEGPLTKAAGIQALIEFRESVIRADVPNWEAHRSILRDAMIETFVSQHFKDPDEWFTKVPTFLRQGTNPIEKNKYLERICEIVSRIDAAMHSQASTPTADDFGLTSPERQMRAVQTQVPLGAGTKPSKPPVHETVSTRRYVITDFSASGLRPDASRFYDGAYRTNLRQMIALVLATEAPIYEDVLVDRIARAHGFQRSGNNIYQTITGIIGREFRRSKDDDRSVIWSNGIETNTTSPYRESSQGMRSHADIPIAELASLAAPFVRLRMSDEDVLRRMADYFQLGRLREATRGRFEKALKLAQHSLQ